MKRLALILSLILSAAGVVAVAVTAEPVKSPAPNISTFMRLKLEHSQKVLEGIALEDFELIVKNAQSMSLLGEDEKWMVFQTPEYRQHSAEFQQICRTLQKSAEARNLDGAALAYVQLTMTCVNCHKYTRGIRMASWPGGNVLNGIALR
jgi:hypothetical protein